MLEFVCAHLLCQGVPHRLKLDCDPTLYRQLNARQESHLSAPAHGYMHLHDQGLELIDCAIVVERDLLHAISTLDARDKDLNQD